MFLNDGVMMGAVGVMDGENLICGHNTILTFNSACLSDFNELALVPGQGQTQCGPTPT